VNKLEGPKPKVDEQNSLTTPITEAQRVKAMAILFATGKRQIWHDFKQLGLQASRHKLYTAGLRLL
jgi:hypothetical protein